MNRTILVIEDERMMADVLAEKLVKTGSHVEFAVDSESSFREIEKRTPDIILLDLILPGTSGFDILKKLKSDERTKAIPVIILSNLGSTEEIKKGMDMGAAAYLIKANVFVDEVIGKIEEVLSKKNSNTNIPNKIE